MFDPWQDPANIEKLKTLWAEGKLSARQIGREIGGVTRNAILGKAHRLKLEKRREAGSTSSEATAKRKKLAPAHIVPSFTLRGSPQAGGAPVQESPPHSLKIPFMKVKWGECRRVDDEVGPDGLATFCGHTTHRLSSWCEYHFHVVSHTPKPRNITEIERQRRRIAIRKYLGMHAA